MTLMNIISAAKTTPTFVVLMRYAQSERGAGNQGGWLVEGELRVPIDVMELI